MRFHQDLVNKKGRLPTVTGLISPRTMVEIWRDPNSDKISVGVPPEAAELVLKSRGGTLFIPTEYPPAMGSIVSRFLAKVALESMAQCLLNTAKGLAYVVDEPQLNLIRNHARRGTTPVWPTHIRRIYDANKHWPTENGEPVQVVHEFDFLMTQNGELYFVLALCGQEYVINVAGPDIDGYLQWLDENINASPLYHGKNSRAHAMP